MSRWWCLAVVVLAAFWLRTHDLVRRPMHADEANQAVKLGELLETGHYAFDPNDHHGPTLYYAALPVAWLRGEKTLASLTETTVRLVPALAGTLNVLFLAVLAAAFVPGQSKGSRPWPMLAAAALLACSPPAVYYSRYFIQETLLVTFTLGTFVAALRWWRTGLLRWALAAGMAAGLMQATKASAPLFVAVAVVALVMVRAPRPVAGRIGPHLVLAIVAALAVAALFYSSFGRNPAGLLDAVRVYGPAVGRASAGGGHEKPWWYYLALFGWQREGGLVWQQLAFSALALAGLVVVLLAGNKFQRGTAIYTLGLVAAFSLIPYKTPWHAVHFVPGLALLAGNALAVMPWWPLAIALGGFTLVQQFTATRLAVFLRPADVRNPYAYVHSSPDVRRIRPLVEAALARFPEGVVRVIAGEYWPIPWYLRGLPRVGYWSVPPTECDGALIVAAPDLADAVRARLHGNYRESFLGLRPGVICVVFTPEP